MTAVTTAVGRRTRLTKPARRESLLVAAQEVFGHAGYHGAAMDDIALRAGVSKPVLYQHFPSKLELYLALVDEAAAELEASLRTALDTTEDNRQRVEASIAAYFDYVDRDSTAFRLLLESDLRNEPAVRERVERSLRVTVDTIVGTIATETGTDEESARLLAVGLVGLAEVSARWWQASATDVSKEAAVQTLATLAWRGLGAFPRHEEHV